MRPLFEAMLCHADRAPNAQAFADPGRSLGRAAWLAEIAGLASELRRAPDAGQDTGPRTIGILAQNGTGWAVAQFAGVMAGLTVVPLPTFFSDRQLGHVARDAGVELILADDRCRARAAATGVATRPLLPRGPGPVPVEFAEGFAQVIYTSGSTGTPKGVRMGGGQIAWSAAALARATGAGETDRYLSVLPLPMLLETICAVFAPAIAGASVLFEPDLADNIGRGEAAGLARAFSAARPTTCVLVPQVLSALVTELSASGVRAPGSLRFVAVGGAAVPATLVEEAWRLGIPVHEGYGLSECCSVVAVNRPGARRAGTSGRPLDGLIVSIRQGEIVVDGPSVMDGYLGRPGHAGAWRTGDVGAIDKDGFLTVLGRKDNLIVTSWGRNVSPEWVEALLLGDWRIALCVVAGRDAPYLTVLIVPSCFGADWFAAASPDAVRALTARCCAAAPDHATPKEHLVLSAGAAQAAGLLLPGGRWQRAAVERFLAGRRAAVPSLS